MQYLAYFSDPQGFARAWGMALTEEDAIAIAQIELDTYRDKKKALGDPLAAATFTLIVSEIMNVGRPKGDLKMVNTNHNLRPTLIDAAEKAKELGSTNPYNPGISWVWAVFPNRRKAEEFVEWLSENGFEHRGVVHPKNTSSFDVRYRIYN